MGRHTRERMAMELHEMAKEFGAPLFDMSTTKDSSVCFGCCKTEYETNAQFFRSLLVTRYKERSYACCCCDNGGVEHVAAWPKYKVLTIQFDEDIPTPWCCAPGCPLPCCNSVVCHCCFPKLSTATLGLRKPGGESIEKEFVCDGSAETKEKALAWVYGGITEGAEEYHCAAHLRDADLINP